MGERLRVFFYLVLFWLAFMAAARVLFFAYNYDLTTTLTINEILLTFLHGVRMDASISGYFLALSGLLLTFSVWIRGSWIYFAITIFTLFALFLSSVIVVVDLELYRHWGFRMNTAPLLYLGSEGMGSVQIDVIIKLLFILVVLYFSFVWFYLKRISPRSRYLSPTKAKTGVVTFLLSVAMFLPIRGSFTVAPMNTGFVYFHNSKTFANHGAINVVWNFFYSVRKSANMKYPDNFFDPIKTEELFSTLYPQSDSTISVLNTADPNIILIILESFTADVIEPLGGLKGIAPNLNQLCREGLLFNQFYASGDRTDKGIVSILSGYPAQPQGSIIKTPAKTQQLPHLNHYMKKMGYKTSFIYGGDIDFANFRSYLTTGGFDQITSMDDFDGIENESKWGIHDHYMFQKALEELDTTTEKFFKVILTLSSHEPFDVPMKPVIEGQDVESLFLNSFYYSDKSLGDFINECRKKNWWSNSLMIITADHGHRHPGKKELKDKERFKIPLLMLGGALSATDTVVQTLGNQTDIVNTLLGQLSSPSPAFVFSKNLLSPYVIPFTTYFFNDGYGFLMPDKYIIYDNPGKQFLKTEGATEKDLDLSKAYQQKLYTDFNKK